jgi:hypothetical protein
MGVLEEVVLPRKASLPWDFAPVTFALPVFGEKTLWRSICANCFRHPRCSPRNRLKMNNSAQDTSDVALASGSSAEAKSTRRKWSPAQNVPKITCKFPPKLVK